MRTFGFLAPLLFSVNALAANWLAISPQLNMKATTAAQIVDLQNKYQRFSSYPASEIKEIKISSQLFQYSGPTKCASDDPRLIAAFEPSEIHYVNGSSFYSQPLGLVDVDPCVAD